MIYFLNGNFLRGLGIGLIISGLVLSFNGTIVSKAREPLTAASDNTTVINNIYTPKPAGNPAIPTKATIPTINYVNFVVPKSSNSGKITTLLQQAGLIADKDKFELEVEKMRAERHFMAGTFQILKGTSEKEIIIILTKGKK